MERTSVHPAFAPLHASAWEKFFLFMVGVLASTIGLKVGPIQWLELLYFLQLIVLLVFFFQDNLRTVWFKPFLGLVFMWTLFSLVAIALGVASLRFTFYMPPDLPPLAHPLYITLSRVVELAASVLIMMSLADVFRKSPNKLRFTMRVYFWTGVASAIYSYVTYPLSVLGLGDYGTYLVTHRMRGFYNEGGPYGLYLITIFVVGAALWQQHWEQRRWLRLGLLALPVAFALSYSKAAFLAAVCLLLFDGLLARSLATRLTIFVGIAAVLVVGVRTVNITQVLVDLQRSGAEYERTSHLHAGDPNYIYGRVAGAFIIPRMIAAHPYTGIGWGNYGILRNEPDYRGASTWADVVDGPSLGLLAYAADLGIPLLVYGLVCFFTPVYLLRRRRAPIWMINLALMQPLVHIFGAQLNVTYPWIVTAFALGIFYGDQTTHKLQEETAPLQLSWKGPSLLEEGTNG